MHRGLEIAPIVPLDSHFLYSFILRFFFNTVIYQVFLSNINNLRTVVWFQVFLSNINNNMVSNTLMEIFSKTNMISSKNS